MAAEFSVGHPAMGDLAKSHSAEVGLCRFGGRSQCILSASVIVWTQESRIYSESSKGSSNSTTSAARIDSRLRRK